MSVFVSYSRRDERFVHTLHDFLEASGPDVWFDREQPAGEEWWNAILSHAREANVVVYIYEPLVESLSCVSPRARVRGLARQGDRPRPDRRFATEEAPPEVVTLQILDFDRPTTIDWGRLAHACGLANTPRVLPSPLPRPPDPPIADLDPARRNRAQRSLDQTEQNELMHELLSVAEDANDRPDAVRLMKEVCVRDDVLRIVATRLTDYLRTVRNDGERQIPPAIRRVVEDLRAEQRAGTRNGDQRLAVRRATGDGAEVGVRVPVSHGARASRRPSADRPVRSGHRAVRTDLRNFYEEQLARRYPDVSADSHDGDLDNLVGRVWEQSANENPLELHRLLAKFRCSIYLTTEVNSLLTRASKEAGRGARTEYCRWRQEHFEHVDFESPEHGLAVDDYRPTPGRPFRLTHVRNPE